MKRLSFNARLRRDARFELDLNFETSAVCTALVGPSGAGKSTALAILAGLERPERARVVLGDRVLIDTEAGIDLPAERRGFGMVFQDALLFPHLNVEANLRYGAARATRDKRETAPAFAETVAMLELEPLLARRPASLSGGEQRRVALGRALLSGPAMLLLDEPLAALDEALRGRIIVWLETAARRWAIPILFTSHDQGDVARLAKWAVAIEDGRKVGENIPALLAQAAAPGAWRGELGAQNLLRLVAAPPETAMPDFFGTIGGLDAPVAGKQEAAFAAAKGMTAGGAGASQPAGLLGEQRLTLPELPPGAGPGAALHALFSPDAVMLVREDPSGVSARNHLRGRVRGVIELNGSCLVQVDIDGAQAQILARITPAARRELAIAPGVDVFCLIKTSAMRVMQ